MNVKLPAAISECIRAINASDVEAIVSTFAADAYVNDNRREIVGLAAIRGWLMKEIIGARVTVQVRAFVSITVNSSSMRFTMGHSIKRISHRSWC